MFSKKNNQPYFNFSDLFNVKFAYIEQIYIQSMKYNRLIYLKDVSILM